MENDKIQDVLKIREHALYYSRAYFEKDVEFQQTFSADHEEGELHLFHNAMIDAFIGLAALHAMKLLVPCLNTPEECQALVNEFKTKMMESLHPVFARFPGEVVMLSKEEPPKEDHG